jgi:3-dehydroquinate dehydratase I
MTPCIVISEKIIAKAIELINSYSLCEIRLDLCQFKEAEIKEIFSQTTELIATYSTNDSGLFIRIESLKLAIEYGTNYVDIDYNLDSIHFNEVVSMAKQFNTKVIVSYHNLIETPDDAKLKEIVHTSKFRGADYVKIATKTNSIEDNIRILNLYKTNKNLIAFGIGENAQYTRIESLKLGAPFTYVYIDSVKNKIAEGQLSLSEFYRLVKKNNP